MREAKASKTNVFVSLLSEELLYIVNGEPHILIKNNPYDYRFTPGKIHKNQTIIGSVTFTHQCLKSNKVWKMLSE